MKNLLENYERFKRDRKGAEAWNNLPNGPKYDSSTIFAISTAHCKAPLLCRAGQQSQGGETYWETDAPLNNAILRYIAEHWEEIWPSVLEIMQNKEENALLECQTFINDMQEAIDEASK